MTTPAKLLLAVLPGAAAALPHAELHPTDELYTKLGAGGTAVSPSALHEKIYDPVRRIELKSLGPLEPAAVDRFTLSGADAVRTIAAGDARTRANAVALVRRPRSGRIPSLFPPS